MSNVQRLVRKKKSATSYSKITTEQIDLTPKVASELLAANPDNRPLIESRIQQFARDITEDHWEFNGETIIVAETGELNDGQHRCHAVILAGLPIPTMIVRGVPRQSRFTTDQGTTRTTGHFLGMNGVNNPNVIARVAKLLLEINARGEIRKGRGSGAGYLNNEKSRAVYVTKQGVLDYAYEHMGEISAADEVISESDARKLTTSSNLTTLCVLFTRAADKQAAHDFMEALQSGANLAKTNPIYQARERLIAEKYTASITSHKVFEIVIRAWNASRLQKPMSQLRILGEWPDISE